MSSFSLFVFFLVGLEALSQWSAVLFYIPLGREIKRFFIVSGCLSRKHRDKD